MKVFFIYYTESAYLDSYEKAVVIAHDFHEAIGKWQQRFVERPKARMTSIELYWEFPII